MLPIKSGTENATSCPRTLPLVMSVSVRRRPVCKTITTSFLFFRGRAQARRSVYP